MRRRRDDGLAMHGCRLLAQREEHDDPVALEQREACVAAAVLGHELDADRRTSNVSKPRSCTCSDATCALGAGMNNLEQRVADVVRYDLGQSHSVTMPITAP